MIKKRSLQSPKSFPKSIGILGGGQLARMLCQRAREMGMEVHILCEKKDDPAARVCNWWHKGNPLLAKDIRRLMNSVDLMTLESEFIPAETMMAALKKGFPCYPSTENIYKLQDRWPQKEILWDFQIPTSPFMKLNSKDDLDLAFKVYNHSMVVKKRFGGYDGYGTFVIDQKNQLDQLKLQIKDFESQYIVEKKIQFKSEKSMILGRNRNGEFFKYPLLTTLQKNNQCYQVWGPSTHPKENSLFLKIKKMLDHLNYVGVIAFELFDTGKDLIVNEIAPRVHNSGHITMDAFTLDQFELHLRCILNLKFPKLAIHPKSFLMQNLSGTKSLKPQIHADFEGKFYWYEKTENRPKRKMGHINYTGTSISQLKDFAKKDLGKIKL